MKRVLITEDAPMPVGPYSQAIKTGHLIFVSGQLPIDPASGDLLDGDIKEQSRQILKNIDEILKTGDSNLQKLVKLTIFMNNLSDFSQLNEVMDEFFTHEPPARETVEVSNLPLGAQIEISAIGYTDSE